MATYQDLMKQIEDLQKQAESLRVQERTAAIAEVKEKITAFGLTAEELGLVASARATTRKRAVSPVKYLDPVSGAGWSGRGKMPRWLQEAVAAGKDKETFRV